MPCGVSCLTYPPKLLEILSNYNNVYNHYPIKKRESCKIQVSAEMALMALK